MPQQRVDEPFDGVRAEKEITAYAERRSSELGSTLAIKPPNRVKFSWPPHPVSYEFHVLSTEWTGRTTFERYGETFEVEVAETPFGVFGRCESLWIEAKGDSISSMVENLSEVTEPLFARQFAISRALELQNRFVGSISRLFAVDLLKLLYCEDRDVAHEAHEYIEQSHFRNSYFPSLCAILQDRTHPWRRSAQWCVLDLFEDLPTYTSSVEDERRAVEVMKGLLWDAADDFARAIYKAGVVLGGHLPHRFGGEALLECLNSPSKIGRRSAIHGLFHVVEWVPEMQDRVVRALRDHAKLESDAQLSVYSFAMADDILAGGPDHTLEPIFADEP
jgi:hypothetical protein